MLSKREQVAREIHSAYKKDVLVKLILDYVKDMSWDKNECVDNLTGIFGENAFDYSKMADKLFAEDFVKVNLFAGK